MSKGTGKQLGAVLLASLIPLLVLTIAIYFGNKHSFVDIPSTESRMEEPASAELAGQLQLPSANPTIDTIFQKDKPKQKDHGQRTKDNRQQPKDKR